MLLADPKSSRSTGVRPGVYFQILMLGYLEGLGSERGIAWRCADSISLREFLGCGLRGNPPEHSTLSKTRKRMSLAAHASVFSFVLTLLKESGLLSGQTLGMDATTWEASAAMRSILRRESGMAYEAWLEQLARSSGIETPTRADLAKVDLAVKEVVADKGYHSNKTMTDMKRRGQRSYVSEPNRGRRQWKDKLEAQKAVYANWRRIPGNRGKRLLRQRG